MPKPMRELGYAYRKTERFNDAMRNYNQAIRLKPDYAPAVFRFGRSSTITT